MNVIQRVSLSLALPLHSKESLDSLSNHEWPIPTGAPAFSIKDVEPCPTATPESGGYDS